MTVPTSPLPVPSPPSPSPATCWGALLTLAAVGAAVLGVVMYWRGSDPAWLAFSMAALGARR